MQLIGVLITLLVISVSSVFLYTHFSSPNGANNQTPQQVVSTASDESIKADIQNMRSLLEQYRVQSDGNYPDSLEALVTAKMISRLPQNPRSLQPYDYTSDGKSYTLSTSLSTGEKYEITSP